MNRLRLAAPSWVVPGTIWENCVFLQGVVDEVALLFFEEESCLKYGRRDLPAELADLSFSWHVHLPSDPGWWGRGGQEVCRSCLSLLEKTDFLGADRAVLHPPCAGGGADARLLDSFAREWTKAGRSPKDVLLENTRENDLIGLADCVSANGFGLCVDLGHMLAYEQRALAAMVADASAPLWTKAGRPRMAHINAPGKGERQSAHLPLDALDAAGKELGESLCSLVADDGVIVAEFFDWRYVSQSLPLIDDWRSRR